MARGSYKSKNKAAVLYVKEILENYSTIEKPLSNTQIKRILADYPYNLDIHRETIKEILNELAIYDDDLYKCEMSDQEGTDGYTHGWYYNRSSSSYDNIKSIVQDIYYNPAIPLDMAKNKADELMSLIPKSYKTKSKKDLISDNIIVRQNELDEKSYEVLNQIKQLIKDNKGNIKKEKWINFNFFRYTIKNKKIELKKFSGVNLEVLPLAIVEWNYHYWMICYIEKMQFYTQKIENKIGHFRIDLMRDIKIIEKEKEKNPKKTKLIEKVSTSDAIKKYMNEHIYFGNSNGREIEKNDKVYTCTLKIKNNYSYGITYFYDIFHDDFKVIEENEDYYLVKVRCTQNTIENIVLGNPELIELVQPEEIQSAIAIKLQNITKEIMINTNQALAHPLVYLFQEKMAKKVADDEKWFYVDFVYDNVNDRDDKYQIFVDYLIKNGFKEMAMKKEYKDDTPNRYLTTNKYNSYQEIAALIKDFGSKYKGWFYHYIKTYSIYEYSYGLFTDDKKDNKEREFYRVYYYKGLNADLYPKKNYSDTLKQNYLEKKEGKNVK